MNFAALFSLDGRETRLNFWRLYMAINLATAVVWCADLFAVIGLGPWAGLLFLPLLPLGAMMSALVVRRVHDRGKNAAWALFFVFGPLILTEPAQALASQTSPWQTLAVLGMSFGGLALSIWGFIEIGLMKGAPGDNRYGPGQRTGGSPPNADEAEAI